MGRRVRIFHLSDLHARSTSGPQGEFATREAPFRNRVIGPAWDNHLRELKADGIAAVARVALKQWLAGLPAVFPAGTYKLRGKPGVVIQE